MDESAHPNKPAPETPTPEVAQLLRLLEIQAAAQRDRRSAMPKAFQGASFRYGSLVVIVIFAIGSIALMEWVIAQLPKPPGAVVHAPASQSATSTKNANQGSISGENPVSKN